MIVWTTPAKKDLKSIFNYFKYNVSLKKAQQTIDSIFDKLEIFNVKNTNTELIGQQELDLTSLNQNHRYLIEGNYKIIYFISDRTIYVTHVFDTRQDPVKKLDIY